MGTCSNFFFKGIPFIVSFRFVTLDEIQYNGLSGTGCFLIIEGNRLPMLEQKKGFVKDEDWGSGLTRGIYRTS
jgi:hypothetical protein